ncbi:Conserved hypothetical protein [Candidatus Hamiltonella defensa (Bemisia tabaci)]|nr:Conserved hypothetical protein [Candidatus Hamiltonella defensa (Bemisia tabaci)]
MPGPVHHKNIPPIHHHTPTSQPDKLSRFLKALRKVSNDICTRLVNLFCCCFSKPPKNPQGQAKIDENDSAETLKIKEESARKIQEYFRRHVKRVREAKRNHYGIVSSEPYDGTKPEHKGRIYYFQINDQGILCAMYSPTEKPESPIEGAFKKVTGMDGNFVELKKVKGNSFGKEINDNGDLKDTFTVIPSIAVNGNTIIARFGGDNLFDYLQKKNFINSAHFENAVKDLTTLHKRSTYLTDIKVENFTYDGKNVNFIDVDNRVKIDPIKPKIIKPDMTAACTTTKLLRVLRPDAFDKIFSFFLTPEAAAAKKPYLKVCDEYAFLLAMIEATTRKSESRIAFNAVPIGNMDQINGMMNDKNKSYFRKWIQKHVKPEFHSNVESILRDPHEYAEKSSNPPYLSDMLLFKGSYNA